MISVHLKGFISNLDSVCRGGPILVSVSAVLTLFCSISIGNQILPILLPILKNPSILVSPVSAVSAVSAKASIGISVYRQKMWYRPIPNSHPVLQSCWYLQSSIQRASMRCISEWMDTLIGLFSRGCLRQFFFRFASSPWWLMVYPLTTYCRRLSHPQESSLYRHGKMAWSELLGITGIIPPPGPSRGNLVEFSWFYTQLRWALVIPFAWLRWWITIEIAFVMTGENKNEFYVEIWWILTRRDCWALAQLSCSILSWTNVWLNIQTNVRMIIWKIHTPSLFFITL